MASLGRFCPFTNFTTPYLPVSQYYILLRPTYWFFTISPPAPILLILPIAPPATSRFLRRFAAFTSYKSSRFTDATSIRIPIFISCRLKLLFSIGPFYPRSVFAISQFAEFTDFPICQLRHFVYFADITSLFCRFTDFTSYQERRLYRVYRFSLNLFPNLPISRYYAHTQIRLPI